MKYLIGVDGGGTGCRATISSIDGKPLGSGNAGSANIMTNFTEAENNICLACENACLNAGLTDTPFDRSGVFLGLAGANVGDYAQRLKQRLPFQQIEIDTDAVTSLEGAIGSKDGVVAIIGTGSVFIYRVDGVIHTAGGRGFMVGDLGSGSRLGRTLLQETLLAFDHIHTGSDLTNQVLEQFENDPRTIVEYAHKAKPGEFGSFAPLIFEYADKDDPIACQIIRKSVGDIEETLEAILVNDSQQFCMLGGLGKKYIELLNPNLRKRVCEPKGDAVSGAISLAKKHFSMKAIS